MYKMLKEWRMMMMSRRKSSWQIMDQINATIPWRSYATTRAVKSCPSWTNHQRGLSRVDRHFTSIVHFSDYFCMYSCSCQPKSCYQHIRKNNRFVAGSIVAPPFSSLATTGAAVSSHISSLVLLPPLPPYFMRSPTAAATTTTARRTITTTEAKSNTPQSTTTTSTTTSIPTTMSVVEYIENQVQLGHLYADQGQIRVARRLSKLQEALDQYDNQPIITAYHEERLRSLIHHNQKEKLKKQRQQQQQQHYDHEDVSQQKAHHHKPESTNTDQVYHHSQQSTSTPIPTSTDPLAIPSPSSTLSSSSLSSNSESHEEVPQSAEAAVVHHQDAVSRNTNDTITTSRIPRGMYIYGSVGTGKSMLMDLFFQFMNHNNTISTTCIAIINNHKKKQRYHFHAFMTMIHQQIYQIKKQNDFNKKQEQQQQEQAIGGIVTPRYDPNTNASRTCTVVDDPIDYYYYENNNPIEQVGQQLAQQISLLCLDEFQIIDIADAYILSQLLDTLWKLGTVIVITSNRSPHDLVHDPGGVMRMNSSYFLSFIDLLQKHCILHHLPTTIDYRRRRHYEPTLLSISNDKDDNTNEINSAYYWVVNPMDPTNKIQIQETLDDLVYSLRNGLPQTNITLNVSFQRTFTISQADDHGIVARLNFDEICRTDLGSTDFHAIANSFRVVIIENIPVLSTKPTQINEARRFLTLIDELYEARVALACTAAASPCHLLLPTPEPLLDSDMVAGHDKVGKNMLIVNPVIPQGHHELGAMANVRELFFAFERVTSRMYEMTSSRWWEIVNETGR